MRALSLLFLLSCASAQQAPWGRPNVPVSSRDRVYAADQTSNTVSVIDPSTNKLLGVIRLGDPVPGALSALYIRRAAGSRAWLLAGLENAGRSVRGVQFRDIYRHRDEPDQGQGLSGALAA